MSRKRDLFGNRRLRVRCNAVERLLFPALALELLRAQQSLPEVRFFHSRIENNVCLCFCYVCVTVANIRIYVGYTKNGAKRCGWVWGFPFFRFSAFLCWRGGWELGDELVDAHCCGRMLRVKDERKGCVMRCDATLFLGGDEAVIPPTHYIKYFLYFCRELQHS